MQNSETFFGTREEWLKTEEYLYDDIYSDEFAVNFETKTNSELIEMGNVCEPKFIENNDNGLPF